MVDAAKKRQIRNLLFITGSALLFSFAFSVLFLYNYGPTGTVVIKDVLLSPDILAGLNFNDTNKKTGGMSRFIFDKIQFEYDDLQNGTREKKIVSNDAYRAFYEKIKSNKSLLDLNDEIKNAFNKGRNANLKIYVRTTSSTPLQFLEKVFQEIEFSKNDNYFRVQLRESDSSGANFAYFSEDGIYKAASTIFLRGY